LNTASSKTKKGLGRGLSALISSKPVPITPEKTETPQDSEVIEFPQGAGESTSGLSERVRYVEIEKLFANPDQPRQTFIQEEINELSESIKSLGVLQPVLVRKKSSPNGEYEVIAGERRLRAAKQANLTQLPVIIRDFGDRECLEIAIVENVQRSNLSPMEEARAYLRLVEEFSMSQKEVAEKVGKDRATVANVLRVLKLPATVQEMLAESKITMGHAKAILTVKEPAAQISLAKKVIEEGLSVRALEKIVSRNVDLELHNNPKDKKNTRPKGLSSKSPFPELVDKIRKSLGTKVNLKHHPSGRGKIEIEYFSEDELDRLIDKLS